MPRVAGDQAVGDEFDRVAHPGVFGDGAVKEIEFPGLVVHHDVFDQRAEADRIVDLGFVFMGEVDALREAAAFHVEDAVAAPAVLVVADEPSVRVCGNRGLAGAGKAEENGDVARLADVGRAVHREHAFLGQEVVHHGEHGLLDLAVILAAADQHQLFGKVDDDRRFGAGAVQRGNAVEARSRDNGEIRLEAGKLVFCRADQQLVDEKVLAGQLVDDAEALARLRVRAGKAVEHEDLPALKIGENAVLDGLEFLVRKGDVDLAPIDLAVNVRRVDGELVVRGPASIFPGGDHQRPRGGKTAFAAAQGLFHKKGGGKIAIHGFGVDDTQLFQGSYHDVVLL